MLGYLTVAVLFGTLRFIGERPYFWDRRTGETCWEMEEGYLAGWWLRPDGFYVRVADGAVFETIDDL